MVNEPTDETWTEFLEDRALSAAAAVYESAPTLDGVVVGDEFHWSTAEELTEHFESFFRRITPDDEAARNAATASAELLIAQMAASAGTSTPQADDQGDDR